MVCKKFSKKKKEYRNIATIQLLVSLNRRLTMSLDRSNFSADKEATFDNDPDPAYPRSRKRYGIAIFFFFLNKILPKNSAKREKSRGKWTKRKPCTSIRQLHNGSVSRNNLASRD